MDSITTTDQSPAESELKETQNPPPINDLLDKAQPEAPVAHMVTGFSWVLVVISILTSTFLFGLDNTIVADVQPAIVNQFNSVNRLPWLSVAFQMGAASTTLFWGQMYSQCNAKWLYITCITIFEIGSAVCGAAPNMDALIVSRAICGLGGTGMYTGVLTLLSVLTVETERAKYFALSGMVWGLGTVLGPIIGGAFTSSAAGWRWAFYINLIVAAICAPVYLFIVPSLEPRPGVSFSKRFVEIDTIGTILLVGIYLSGLMAISFGGVLYAWNSGRIIALFVIACVLFLTFLGQQFWSLGTTPLRRAFPIQFFRNKALSIVFILECCTSTLTYIPVYFLPLYFQFVRQDSAITAGVRLLPFVIFLVAAILVNGFVMTVNSRYMPWFFASGALGLVGSALLYTIDLQTSNARLYGFSILIGTGAGFSLQLPFSVVQSLVPPESIPKAVAFVTFAQLGAPSVVLSVANAIYLNEAKNNIARAITTISGSTVTEILSGVGSATFVTLDGAQQQIILEFIVGGLNRAYILSMTSGALAVILSLFLSRGKMFG
ncbi:Efflux pump [Lachnellula arida]|uniref:Efflux pump n=1 Tax=Lachnellula arida TaxID=1316785 RepID=A0A8T9BFJ0_9HELO|nr:Efflux pump [Lachnellula arida]